MAVVKKTGTGKVPVSTKLTVTLPTKQNDPSDKLSDYSMLFYGAKKIGKTSFASHFPDSLFLALEPGTKALRVYSLPVQDWRTFVAAIDAIIADKSGRYKTIVVDTIDLAYTHAFFTVCKERGIAHPNDEKDYGATWGEIRKRFREQITRLLYSGRGTIFLSHETEHDIELRDGGTATRTQPTMSKQALDEVEGVVDIIGHYHYVGQQRALRIDGLETVVSGNRLEEKLIRKGGAPRTAGDRILRVPMGGTSKSAYDNFITAFNNQQVSVDPLAVAAKPKPTTTPAKKFFIGTRK